MSPLRHAGFAALLGVLGLALAGVAWAAPMYGEPPQGTQKGLGGIGIPVSWANPNTVLYTCNNPNRFVVLHVVPRNPIGNQPLSYSLQVTPGGTAATTFTTSINMVTNDFGLFSSQIVTGSMGQSVVLTPLTTTTGSITVDLLGYEGL